jgi:hypothetical protein
MKIGPLEVRFTQQNDGHWIYEVQDTRSKQLLTYGYRPTEHQAREAGWEEASMIRVFV